MAYESFDPRKSFRENLGTQWDVDEDGEIEYCITVTDNYGFDKYVPIYLTEETSSGDLPTFPFIEFEIQPGDTTYEPHDIKAATRKVETIITVHIYFTDTDDIDRTKFAKKIKDELQDLVRTNQSSTTGITFMNINNDGAVLRETNGRQVVYHYIGALYCLYYDLC